MGKNLFANTWHVATLQFGGRADPRPQLGKESRFQFIKAEMMMTVMERGFACVVNRVAPSNSPSLFPSSEAAPMAWNTARGGMHNRRPHYC